MNTFFKKKLLLVVIFGLIFSSIIFTSCGYHLRSNPLCLKYKTISIPYVEGDEQGKLTSQLIQQICNKGGLDYRLEDGDLTLNVQLMGQRNDSIGFGYENKKKNHFSHIESIEERLQQTAVVSLIEKSTGNVIVGPLTLTAKVEYDHDTSSSHRQPILKDSLGQLDQFLSSKEQAYVFLYKKLADQIVHLVYYAS